MPKNRAPRGYVYWNVAIPIAISEAALAQLKERFPFANRHRLIEALLEGWLDGEFNPPVQRALRLTKEAAERERYEQLRLKFEEEK